MKLMTKVTAFFNIVAGRFTPLERISCSFAFICYVALQDEWLRCKILKFQRSSHIGFAKAGRSQRKAFNVVLFPTRNDPCDDEPVAYNG